MRRRLVDEHQLGLLHIGLRYQRALPLPRGAERQLAVAYGVEAEGPEGLAGYALVVRGLPPEPIHIRISAEDHHVHDGHPEGLTELGRNGGHRLGHLGGLHRRDVGPVHGDASGRRVVYAGYAAHHGGLAAAVGAYESDQLPLPQLQVYAVQGAEGPEVLHQPLYPQYGIIGHRTRAPSSSACTRTRGSRSSR